MLNIDNTKTVMFNQLYWSQLSSVDTNYPIQTFHWSSDCCLSNKNFSMKQIWHHTTRQNNNYCIVSEDTNIFKIFSVLLIICWCFRDPVLISPWRVPGWVSSTGHSPTPHHCPQRAGQWQCQPSLCHKWSPCYKYDDTHHHPHTCGYQIFIKSETQEPSNECNSHFIFVIETIDWCFGVFMNILVKQWKIVCIVEKSSL